ncbi:hypothetical protein CLOP_g11083 [Closterium sp. NIES-67]|nr:hypothetical protein CLOP_g11083 [Closterium sp. NIES-67]
MSSSATSVLTNVARLAITLGVGGSLLNASLYTVDGGHRAVLFESVPRSVGGNAGRGHALPHPLAAEALHLRRAHSPPLNHFRYRNKRPPDGESDAGECCRSQRPPTCPTIFKTLGTDYDERVLPSIGNEVLKAVVAQFNADQLLTERPYVSTVHLILRVACTEDSFSGFLYTV